MSEFISIILAAGRGKRMNSAIPKPLHKVAGLSLLGFTLKSLQNSFLNSKDILNAKVIVISQDNLSLFNENLHKEREILFGKNSNFSEKEIKFSFQDKKLGTGHAVMSAKKHINQDSNVIILYGDTPFIKSESIIKMMEMVKGNKDVVCLGFESMQKSNTYGKMITDGENLLEIIEYKDANDKIKSLNLCNSGIMVAKGKILLKCLDLLKNNNLVQEYYLTDIVKIANDLGFKCGFLKCMENEVMGINSREELEKAERYYQSQLCKFHMEKGVNILNPELIYFSFDTKIAQDTVLEDHIHFGLGVEIGSNVLIKSFSYLEGCKIQKNCVIGPFARIRHGTILKENVFIGNFVEIKNTLIEKGTKAGHLAYLGDAQIGERVNIGAGVITCNYDGFKKHETNIENDVFIGSNSCLIAPINIRHRGIIAASSTICAEVPEDSIAISRTKQKNIEKGAIRYRKRKKINDT